MFLGAAEQQKWNWGTAAAVCGGEDADNHGIKKNHWQHFLKTEVFFNGKLST